MAYWVPLSGQVAFLWDLVKDASTLVKSALLSLSVRTCFFSFLWTWSFFCKASQDSVTAFPQGLVFPSVGSKWCNSMCSYKDFKVCHVTNMDNGKQTSLFI